jgi:hypothetical protein
MFSVKTALMGLAKQKKNIHFDNLETGRDF